MQEIWKPVVGFEGLYEVSNLGRIKTVPRILNPSARGDGYFPVALYGPRKKKQRLVHTIVLEAFKGERPPGKVGRHLDGIRSHNSIDNLEWGTPAENSSDRIRHGTVNQGERHGIAKLTNQKVLEIRKLREAGHPAYGLAKRFAVTPSNVYHILSRSTWSHI